MVMVLVISPVLKAVDPPVVDVLAMVPADPVDLSQALYFMVAVPLKSVSGTKRTLWVEAPVRPPSSNRAEDADTLPKLVKEAPLSIENCQSPLVLVTSVTAIPTALPSSTSVAAAALRKVETLSPLLVAGSSRMVVKLSLAVKLLPLGLVRNPPDVVKTGASLTALTVMVKALGISVLLSPPSLS